MNDLKNLFKITLKRYGLWILLISLLLALMNSLQTKGMLKNDSKNLKEAVATMAEDLDVNIDNSKKITKEYLDEANVIAEKYKEKYSIKSDEEINKMDETEWEEYTKISTSENGNNFWNYENNYRTFVSIKNSTLDGTMGRDLYLQDTTSVMIILVCILAIIITSLEQSLPFYEFTLMYPWKKKDEVWMKSIIIFIIGISMFLINLAFNILMINSSDFGPLLNILNLGDVVLKSILLILATSIISVSLGMTAGNFVGHIGLGIIAIGSIGLVRMIVFTFLNIFSQNLVIYLNQMYNNILNKIPEFISPFFGLLRVNMNYASIFGYLLIAILWAILAYLINDKLNSEKSGYLILSKPVEKIAKLFGIFTLTSLLFIIGSATLFGFKSMLLELVIYALSLLLSVKLFDILFKVRLKF